MILDGSLQASELREGINRGIRQATDDAAWTPATAGAVEQLFDEHKAARQRHTAGWVLGSVGLGVTVAGIIPLHFGTLRAARRQLSGDWETAE
jgi:hypothetical protein